jgi:hypothetical protein
LGWQAARLFEKMGLSNDRPIFFFPEIHMPRHFELAAGLGAHVLAAAVIGYAVYDLFLYPAAGFPTNDYAEIVAGANTLRLGHLLKFAYAGGLALVMVGLRRRSIDREVDSGVAGVLGQLGAIAGAGAVALFVASGMLGLNILNVAVATFDGDHSQAITTILLRTVTTSLFDGALFASGWYILLVSAAGLRAGALERGIGYLGVVIGSLYILLYVTPEPYYLIAPLATLPWAAWLAVTRLRQPARTMAAQRTSVEAR